MKQMSCQHKFLKKQHFGAKNA